MADPICPECANGKHANCDAQAFDEATDQIVDCSCDADQHAPGGRL